MKVAELKPSVRLGQYEMIWKLARIKCKGIEYLVAISGAYNAMGLIGPEFNGIVVINETRKGVVLDRHACADSGYLGATSMQLAEFRRILKMSAVEFLTFCTTHPRYRGAY
jgi:hypothetical protein